MVRMKQLRESETMGDFQESRKLFTPLRLGDMDLSHRIIMSPLTRTRCPGGLPDDLVVQMYAQRATPGGLLIAEGAQPSMMAGNLHNVPNIYAPEHVRAWKSVTDAVHTKGAYIVCQLWHVGRFAVSTQLGGRQPLSSSATNIGLTNLFTPQGRVPTEVSRAMTLQEVLVTIEDHVHAAKCAMEAGFDAVEITAGNGWLLDQFINSKVNTRTDQYGGTKENRCRLILELIDAVVAAIGPSKVAVRFSPWGTFVMPLDSDPISTFTYMLSEIDRRGLAYVCLTQPRSDKFLPEHVKLENLRKASEDGSLHVDFQDVNLKPFLKALQSTPKLANGGYDGENCFEEVGKGEIDAVTFGKYFISNPDLVERIKYGKKLAPWRQESFYASGSEGYTDYPVAN